MGRPQFHGGDGVRHGDLGIVVRVNADHPVEVLADVRHDLAKPRSQRTAVRVAQDEAVRARGLGRFEGAEREIAIRAIAVEEVLGVVNHLATQGLQVRDSGMDHLQVLLFGHAQGAFGVQPPTLAEDRDGGRLGIGQHPDVRIVRDGIRNVSRGTERDQSRLPQVEFRLGPFEELGVTRVRAGPAAFDVRDAQLVQLAGDGQLVSHRERDVLALRSVPQGRVVDQDPHRPLPLP